MTVRPARLCAALLGFTIALGAAGCAGTDSAAPGRSSSAAPESTSGATSGTSAVAGGRRIEVEMAGGQLSGDTGRVPVRAGEHVTLVITSDVADEVHVHGYDVEAELSPGEPVELTFDATVPGVFEVELHEADTVLLTLQVG
jgi:heme/copper-type cytochrome/quinol oxidase subunit 2